MATTNNFLFNGMRGAIGKQFVVKQYPYGTVVTAYPDMSKIKPTKLQKQVRRKFTDAVAYAKGVLADPKLSAKYQKKVKNGKSVYHAAIKAYMLGE